MPAAEPTQANPTTMPDTGPYIERILQSYEDQDTSTLRQAISDAFNEGIPVEHLITVLAGHLTDALQESAHE